MIIFTSKNFVEREKHIYIIYRLILYVCFVYFAKHFFFKENFIHPHHNWPYYLHYVLILFIHCILLSKEILLIAKIFAFGRRKVCICSAYLLQNEFQRIIWMLKHVQHFHAYNYNQKKEKEKKEWGKYSVYNFL